MTSPTSCAAPSTEPDVDEAAERRPERRLFGRRMGQRLRRGRRRLLDELLPRLSLPLPPPGARLEPRSLFGDDRPLWLEIGFGGGEHLAAQSAARPEIGMLGVEPFVNGVARLLGLLDRQGTGNVRVLVDDARLLLAALPDASIDRAFVLFPDPWPKLRHHKRRIVNPDTVGELARVLAPTSELRLATDDLDYARWMLATMLAEPRFIWLAERAADWRSRPADWPATRYEMKALAAGRAPVFLRFERILLSPAARSI